MSLIPLRVGLLGFGFASQTFHAPLIQSVPGLRLAAVSSSQPAKVAQALGGGVEVFDSAEQLIDQAEVDLVVVPTPNATHHPLARAALLAGRHVVVDKPFTLDAAQAQDLVALARTQERVLSVFHNRRWDADFLTVRRLLAAGTLGSVRHAALHFDRFRPQVRQRWREDDVPGAGLWMDLAPHLLDQALQLFGPPAALRADIAALRPGARTNDHFDATLHYPDGLRVRLHASMLSAAPAPRFALHGTVGSFVKWGEDPQEDALKAGRRPDTDAGWGIDPRPGELTLADGDALATRAVPSERGDQSSFYRQLVDAIQGIGPNPVEPDDALQVMRLLDLGVRSAREGRLLDMDSGRRGA
jgi:predicted dehydrogenase